MDNTQETLARLRAVIRDAKARRDVAFNFDEWQKLAALIVRRLCEKGEAAFNGNDLTTSVNIAFDEVVAPEITRLLEARERALEARRAKWRANAEAARAREMPLALKSIGYRHVYMEEGACVHERRPGKLDRTLCGIKFNPWIIDETEEPYVRDMRGEGYLKCKVCKRAGGLTAREEQALCVSKVGPDSTGVVIFCS